MYNKKDKKRIRLVIDGVSAEHEIKSISARIKGSTFVPSSKSAPEPQNAPLKIRHGGHFVDQTLISSRQTIEYTTTEDRLGGIEKHGITREGIALETPAEYRMIYALYLLIQKSSSEYLNSESDNFYTGNLPTEYSQWGKGKSQVIKIKVSRHELYKAFTGKSDYSGRDIKEIDGVLEGLKKRQCLIRYHRKYKESGKIKNDLVEGVYPLLTITEHHIGISNKELEDITQQKDTPKRRRGELEIAFNPIFTDQIKEKWINYPSDIIPRLTRAAEDNGNRLTTSHYKFLDYSCRELSSKRTTFELNEDNFHDTIGFNKHIRDGRRALADKQTNEMFSVFKNLGLLKEHKKTTGSNGQSKYVFTLNKDFQ